MENVNGIQKSGGAAPVNPVQTQQLQQKQQRVQTPPPAQRNDNLNISGTAAASQRQRAPQAFRVIENPAQAVLRTAEDEQQVTLVSGQIAQDQLESYQESYQATQGETNNSEDTSNTGNVIVPNAQRLQRNDTLTDVISERQQETFQENFRGARAETFNGTLAQSPQTEEAVANQTTPVAQQQETVDNPENLNLTEQIAATQQDNFQNANPGAALPANEGTLIQSPATAARLAEANGTAQSQAQGTAPTPETPDTGGIATLATGTEQRNQAASGTTPPAATERTTTPPAERTGETNFVEATPREVGPAAARNQSEDEILPPQNPQQVDLISGQLGEN